MSDCAKEDWFYIEESTNNKLKGQCLFQLIQSNTYFMEIESNFKPIEMASKGKGKILLLISRSSKGLTKSIHE